jgi:hypothetical protein
MTEKMRINGNKLRSIILGLVALCAAASPAASISWTPPGVTMGIPAGAVPSPGLYFGDLAHYGTSPTKTVSSDVPFFIWSPGWHFLGATYAASVVFPLIEIGLTGSTKKYFDAPFNPLIIPMTLSWNLGEGFFVSVSEGGYVPVNTATAFSTSGVTSGAAFETRSAISYLHNDWILSANSILGLTTADAVGLRQADYLNVDWTAAHTFGKWELGAVGYGAWDIETTAANKATGRGRLVGVGGLVGYNFGVLTLTLEATHAVVQGGNTNYGKDDTRVWSSLVIPIWTPTPPAGQGSVSAR